MAPELLSGDVDAENNGEPSFASDIYAVAIVIWEVRLRRRAGSKIGVDRRNRRFLLGKRRTKSFAPTFRSPSRC